MISTRLHPFTALVLSALVVAACGGGSDAAETTPVEEQSADEPIAEADDVTDPVAVENDDANDSSDVASTDAGDPEQLPVVDAPVDPVFHHVSAEAPAGSWGPLCNPGNQDSGIPGWRVSVPPAWTRQGVGGSSGDGSDGFAGVSFGTPDGDTVSVDWVSSVTSSSALGGGTPVGDVDFDGETVSVMDHGDEAATIFSIDFVAQSAGGFVEMTGEPAVHQVAVSAPIDMGMTQDEAVAILTSLQRERCAIFDALTGLNTIALAPLLPMFDGGDPLGKTAPTSQRLAYDPASAIFVPATAYTEDQLAYIVGFDQATSECFVGKVVSTLPDDPTDVEAIVAFADPITPDTEEEVAAQQAALAGC